MYNVNDVATGYDYYFKTLLNKMIQMFQWNGLPNTCDTRFLNRELLLNGNILMTKQNDDIVIVSGGMSGKPDKYGYGKDYTFANVEFSGTVPLNENAICFNNSLWFGNSEFIGRYARLMADADSSISIAEVMTRFTNLLTASTKQAQAQAQSVIDSMIAGKYAIGYDNALYGNIDSKQIIDNNRNVQSLESLVKVRNALYHDFCVEIGIPMVAETKKAQLVEQETIGVKTLSQINVGDMLKCRQEFCDVANDRFDLDISVRLGDEWLVDTESEVDNNEDTE